VKFGLPGNYPIYSHVNTIIEFPIPSKNWKLFYVILYVINYIKYYISVSSKLYYMLESYRSFISEKDWLWTDLNLNISSSF
jgi:hypothetical protein